jgi:hypothetical protein
VNAWASFDQYDPRLTRVDVAEVLPQILMCEFSDRAGQFHACRPAAKALRDEPLPLFAAASVREAKTVTSASAAAIFRCYPQRRAKGIERKLLVLALSRAYLVTGG